VPNRISQVAPALGQALTVAERKVVYLEALLKEWTNDPTTPLNWRPHTSDYPTPLNTHFIFACKSGVPLSTLLEEGRLLNTRCCVQDGEAKHAAKVAAMNSKLQARAEPRVVWAVLCGQFVRDSNREPWPEYSLRLMFCLF
jgi:hypothetical protein